MVEKQLDFNPLEARGLFLVQSNVLDAASKAAQAAQVLKATEADAAALLAGRVPEGVTIREIRIDQATGRIFAPLAAPPPPTSP